MEKKRGIKIIGVASVGKTCLAAALLSEVTLKKDVIYTLAKSIKAYEEALQSEIDHQEIKLITESYVDPDSADLPENEHPFAKFMKPKKRRR